MELGRVDFHLHQLGFEPGVELGQRRVARRASRVVGRHTARRSNTSFPADALHETRRSARTAARRGERKSEKWSALIPRFHPECDAEALATHVVPGAQQPRTAPRVAISATRTESIIMTEYRESNQFADFSSIRIHSPSVRP